MDIRENGIINTLQYIMNIHAKSRLKISFFIEFNQLLRNNNVVRGYPNFDNYKIPNADKKQYLHGDFYGQTNGLNHGIGIFKYNNGKFFEGQWKDGIGLEKESFIGTMEIDMKEILRKI
jgi:hypothetical protein